MENIIQKYTIGNILYTESPDFIFFWGNRKSSKITRTCFSQWYDRGFVIDGIQYKCAEQYMMAQKARVFGDDEIFELILKSDDPKDIKALGRKVKGFNSDLWNENKFRIVLEGNYAKFSQNEDLRDFLMSTNDKILVEASPYDKIWGIGMRESEDGVNNPKNWKGTNLLGFAIMQVRDMLMKEK